MTLLNARRRAWRRTADVLAVAYRYAAHRRDLLAPEGSRALERARRPRTQRRRARYALASLLARAARAVDPLPWDGASTRAREVGHPSVVEHGYAQGRADLQLVHGVNLGPLRTRPAWVEDLP